MYILYFTIFKINFLLLIGTKKRKKEVKKKKIVIEKEDHGIMKGGKGENVIQIEGIKIGREDIGQIGKEMVSYSK